MAVNDGYLRSIPSDSDQDDGRLYDPTSADAGGTVNYTLVCDAGAYTYSGVAATLKVAHSLQCAAGSYSYTGVDASLKVAHSLQCAAGAYNYSGVAASLKVAHSLVCDAGEYSYSGVAASLKVEHSLVCDAGAYAYTGNAATLTYVPGAATVNYTLTCDAGAYSYAGVDATLTYVRGVTEQYSGGYFDYPNDRKKYKKSKLHEIAELEPELATAIIDAVATVTEKREVQNKDLETAQAEKELRKFLKSQEQQWKKEYAQLIRLEYERREQEYEDAQIAMLLFEM